jgi:hypothetical protein
MKPERRTRQEIVNAVTRRYSTPEMAKGAISDAPVLGGMALGLCALVPPQSSAKLYTVLGIEAILVLWALALNALWKRRAPADSDDAAASLAWLQFSTLIYHLGRTVAFCVFSLAMLANSLLVFAHLGIGTATKALVVSYGISALAFYANRYRLLEISVVGIHSPTWQMISALIMSIGSGLIGIGVTLSTLISRTASPSVGLGIMGALNSLLAVLVLGYNLLELSITRILLDQGMWRRE